MTNANRINFIVGIILVGLKLTGFVNWSWWWITLPFYLGLAVVLLVATVCLIHLVVTTTWDRMVANRKNN